MVTFSNIAFNVFNQFAIHEQMLLEAYLQHASTKATNLFFFSEIETE